MIHFNLKRLFFYWLAPVKRYLPDGRLMLRLRWWQYLVRPLDMRLSNYADFRTQSVIAANVTMQKIVLEWYLQDKIDPSVTIARAHDSGVYVSRSDAPVPKSLIAGLSPNETGVFVGYYNDMGFIINAPQSVEIARVKQVITPYLRAGGLQYNIKTF